MLTGLILAALTGALPHPAARAIDRPAAKEAAKEIAAMRDAMVLDHDAVRIDGASERLDEVYAGKVVLIVNVASRCGYTPQYAGLQALYEEHKGDGLVVLGFPSNEFGGQEPGSEDEILEFCRTRFAVTFPMFAKVSVKGEGAHPLYADLRDQPEPIGGEPRWNFTKFLVNTEGRVVRRFEPADEPDGEAVRRAVKELLPASPAGEAGPG